MKNLLIEPLEARIAPATLSIIAVNPSGIAEGNTGNSVHNFEVTLAGDVQGRTDVIKVNYDTLDGSATLADNDFTRAFGELSFDPGVVRRVIQVNATGDSKVENAETFVVSLSTPTGATIGSGQATGTILNDDGGLFVNVSNASVTEGGAAVFTATLNETRSVPVTVNYTTRDGTAKAGGESGDYVAATGTITFQPGETSKTIAVDTVGDTLRESSERFFLDLTSAQAGSITGIGTIATDEQPRLTMDSPKIVEGDSGSSLLRFTVSLEGETESAVSVKVATANGTATDGSDYVTTSKTLVFAPGLKTAFFDVQITGDTLGEGNETVLAQLSEPVDAIIGTAQATGTIINDDAALSIGPARIVEGNAGTSQAVFTVTLSEANPGSTVTVNFATENGSATAGSDYTTTTGQLTFAPNETSKTISVPIIGDPTTEADETFVVKLSGEQDANLVLSQGTGTIENDDTHLRINDVQIVEGDAGSSLAIFTVTRVGPTGFPLSVKYVTRDGTANSTGDSPDYVAQSGTLNFGANDVSATIVVPVRGDLRGEAGEMFFVDLSEPTGAKLTNPPGDSVGQATITDNDTPSLRIDDVRVVEGAGISVFTVSLSAPSDFQVTVNYSTADGTATVAGDDFTTSTGTLTFEPGVPTKTIQVPLIADSVDEPDETFFVNLSGATNATISDAQGIGTIGNDDTSISIGDVTIVEGNSGTKEAVFVVTLSGASTRASTVTLNYSTANGSATIVDGDYTAANGTLSFAPSESTKEIRIPIVGDLKSEVAETFTVTLSGAQNAQIVVGSGLGTITNDDVVTVSVADVVLSEGDSGTTNGSFTIRLSNPSDREVTVNYGTQDGTATAGSDYTESNGVLTIPVGATEGTISVPILGDTFAESDETFSLNLTGATNATIGDGTAVGTIRDARTITIDDVRVEEGNAGTKVLRFVVALDAAAEQPISVEYATQDGTAFIADGDYVATSGRLDFAEGERTKEILVTLNGDTRAELNETVIVSLSAPMGAALAKDRAEGTIVNDDTTFSIQSATDPASRTVTVTEGNPGGTPATVATFKVVRTNGATAAEVDFSTAFTTGTEAAEANDFTAKNETIFFAVGVLEKTITIPITQDLAREGKETFSVALSNAKDAILAEGQGTGTVEILNDDSAPTLSIGDVQIIEGNGGTKNAVFTVTLSAPDETASVSVVATTKDGTAVAGADYTAKTDTLVFLAGETTKTFAVPVTGDVLDERATESFTVELSAAETQPIQDGVATGTITDDDLPPTISFSGENAGDVSIDEGNAGTKDLVFKVKLSAPSSFEVKVNYSTTDGTAVAGPDYVSKTGTLVFPANTLVLEQSINITISGDTIFEPDEIFTVNLDQPVNATISDTSATGRIRNDEIAPVLAVNSVDVVEGNDGETPAIFTVTLSTASLVPVTVKYETADVTARDGVGDGRAPIDYTAVSGLLTFAPGETSKSIEVPVRGDTFREANETFTVRLFEEQNALLAGGGTGTGRILDDGDTTVGVYVQDVRVVEGDVGTKAATFRIELTGSSTSAINFRASTVNGSATGAAAGAFPPGDYEQVTDRAVALTPGMTSTTVNVNVFGDRGWEDGVSETFFLQLSDLPDGVVLIDQNGGTGMATILVDDFAQIDARTVKYIDMDGDVVTVKISKGVFALSQFDFQRDTRSESNGNVGGRQLRVLDFANTGGTFNRTNLSITAQPQILPGGGLGDGHANVGYIRGADVQGNQGELLRFAGGIDFGSIRISGDLGKIDAGNKFVSSAIGKLEVDSLGTLGTATGAPDTESRTLSSIRKVIVAGDFKGSLNVLGGSFGDIGSVKVGGSLIGGAAADSGQITFTGRLGKATFESIVGGQGANSGAIIGSAGFNSSIGRLEIGEGILGAGGANSGRVSAGKIGVVSVEEVIGGSGASSGAIASGGKLGTFRLSVDSDKKLTSGVVGGAGFKSGQISAVTDIKKLEIEGSVIGGSGINSGQIDTNGFLRKGNISGNITGGSGTASGSLQIERSIGKLSVGELGLDGAGSVIGGDGNGSGTVAVKQNVNSLLLTKDFRGGSGNNSGGVEVLGSIKRLEIKGNIQGGDSDAASALTGSGFLRAGKLSTMILGGDLIAGSDGGGGLSESGAIHVNGSLNSLKIAGSVVGNETTAALISGGEIGGSAFRKIEIGQNVRFAEILAGYNGTVSAVQPRGILANADAQIGSIVIGGNIQSTNIVAGSVAGTDNRFGTADDASSTEPGVRNFAGVVSKIASVIVRGTVEVSETAFGIVAQHIVKVNGGAASVSLISGPSNDLAQSPTDLDPGVEVVSGTRFRAVEVL